MPDPGSPLGIFDSGVGGLTVFRRVAERLPGESIVYLGDTARVPYGTKSAETVVRYARACARLLIERDIKILVVACNTATAYALDVLRDELGIPVLGVIEPGARRAVAATRNGRIGVVGTVGTIASGAYQSVLTSLAPDMHVACKPCPLFVPLAEEGWVSGPVPRQIAETYLAGLLSEGIDTLLLGCTHYPLLREVIQEVAGPGVAIVDSAEATSEVVADILDGMGMCDAAHGLKQYHCLVTDSPAAFARVGQHFLGRDVGTVEWVDFQ
ncbi:MAG: glutamate racemase [Candidatus Hydrogenedentes bacterium]|nr:glutamate racemase [Candidatus Hydrogenedentota bacterium]